MQKNEDINIIQINCQNKNIIETKQDINKKKQDIIIPNHCANFSFTGVIKNNNNKFKELDINTVLNKNDESKQNTANLNLFRNPMDTHIINSTNTFEINDDYVSPTFNLNLDYNSLDKNYNNINTIEYESGKEKEITPETYGSSKINVNNIGIKNYNNLIDNSKDINNINIKKKKKNKKEIITRKQNDKIINNNNLMNQLILNKTNNTTNDLNKMNKTQEKDASITTFSNSNINTKIIKEKDSKGTDSKLTNKQIVSLNNNFKNINNIINSINKISNNNMIIQNKNKNKHNSRYKHYNVDSVHINYDVVLKNLNNSMNESEQRKKLRITPHVKSKSGTGSLIKFQGLHTNIFNIKNYNYIKANNLINRKKRFKSISPKIQRRNVNNGCLKIKNNFKSKSQNRSKTNSKGKNNRNEMNQINLLMKNKKCISNINNICLTKPKTLQEKMDFILSKNIIALTKKLRKSTSPKAKLTGPSIIKNVMINHPNKVVDNVRKNNFTNKNLNRNSSKENSKSKKKSLSPINFNILNNNNAYNLYNLNTNPNSNHKKFNFFQNNINDYLNDNLLVINNNEIMNKKIPRKKTGNSPKNLDIFNNYVNQKKNILVHEHINMNTNYQKVKKNNNTKNIAAINRKGINIYKIEEDFNKRQYNQKNKTNLMNNINKKNNIIIINNIKINNNNNNNNNNKKNMTIIQNFSKYKKKGENNLVNTNKNSKRNCNNENMSNNYPGKGKNINEEKNYRKINMNLNNNIENKTSDNKRKKVIYTNS